MMLPRAIGASLLVLGGAVYGAGLARSMHTRVRELDDLIAALQLMATEISFAQAPLPEACERITRSMRGSVKRLFKQLAKQFGAAHQLHVSQIWQQCLDRWSEHTSLHGEELAILVTLGATLGRTNLDDQARALRYTTERLGAIRQRLAVDLDKHARMRLYFGTAGGLVLAILLV